ncbi:MAG: hypothetical protein A4E48_02652 [Methanosaeta sp. PtaU1.Bin060]|jgi:hypothetical protein|nr:MAG: hypothetical protein A4E48_02652 [Methanosaeta sp. PtaU1.Bin060]
MGIRYESLDEAVRTCMLQELEHDLSNSRLYLSPRLTEAGVKFWPEILREAFGNHDDTWIAAILRSKRLLRTQEQRRKPRGGFTIVKVPHTAADTLAEGEFNRFYARGLCTRVLAIGGTHVEVYRGKDVRNPRPESQAMIGRRLPAQKLLEDLRNSQGVEPALGLPPGPNSGLTVRQLKE